MMKENEFKVVGIKKTKKEDKTSTTLYLETPFSAYEVGNENNDCVGLSVQSEYFFSDLDNVKLGDVVEILYRKNTFTGKAIAGGVTIVSSASASVKK